MKTEVFELGKEIRNASTSGKECSHCGEPCESLDIEYAGKHFCCAGCRSVFTILEKHGLCEYYDREDSGKLMRKAIARETDDDRYAALNDPQVEARLLSFASGTRNRIVWTIPTLHCASCVWLLEQINRLDAGIHSSTVDVMRKTVTIDYDPRETSLATIASTLASIGYAPLIRSEASDNATQSASHAADTSRALYTRIGLAAFAAANTMLMAFAQYLAGFETISTDLRTAFNWIAVLLSIPVLLYSASPWFTAAGAALRQRRISLDVPVAMGILALFVRSIVDIVQGTGEGYLDSFNALVMLLLIGRLFQQKAFDALSFDRTYRSFFPLSVRIRRGDNESVLPIEQILVGDVLSIRNGEVIPCDCTLESKVGYIDYSFVTGESVPVEALKGQTVHAGGQVVGRALLLEASKEVSHSELANMWDRTSKRSSRKTFITLSDSFGRWFTVFAVVFAVAGALIWLPDWTMAFNVFTAVLIIACPCALTLAAPITLGTAMGRLGDLGIYLKNIGTLLDLQRINAVFFDKTGTLTEATHELEYKGRDLTSDEWQSLQTVAAQSAHPISRSIAQISRTTHAPAPRSPHVWNLVEFIGKGISGTAHNEHVALGSLSFVTSRLEHAPDPLLT
ncbi:MAG TPA: heavy metal translocating P-type ATPase metal-binding domain-containing protein, partial [Candidatus Kapabacteria bacterium]|nr:heavy metal translocating P-type ATPase metal-binding domain-containing protein [Candidatus Kapabacteria bacterium]